MALPAQKQAQYWGIAAVAFVLALWFLGDVLLPFVLGGAIAYFIDPVADRLERAGFSRVAATGIITVSTIVLVIVALLSVVPMLVNQLIDLVAIMPQLARDLQAFLIKHVPSITDDQSNLHQMIFAIGETLKARFTEVAQAAVSSALSLLNVVILLVIVPVVAVYLLLDWDRMIARIDDLLPRDYVVTIRRLAKDIDATLAAFVRGMGTVCLILGTYYAIALMVIGLDFGLAVGFIAGLVTFIPYLGALIGGALAIGLALFQFWGDWWSIAGVAIIFAIGQVAEGNFLTPKLVGGSVGLHPVWLLLALSVFGALFGFVGMLIAVPVAASLGVVARFLVDQYTSSRLYMGKEHLDAEQD
ncbi:MAG: AI-2E family transporter [Paracoccaceae bacterium]|jgi:predicted PurR-regulated permease PerM